MAVKNFFLPFLLPFDATVPTSEGDKKVSDVQPGDILYGTFTYPSNETWQLELIELFVKGKEDYDCTDKNLVQIVSENHDLLLSSCVDADNPVVISLTVESSDKHIVPKPFSIMNVMDDYLELPVVSIEDHLVHDSDRILTTVPFESRTLKLGLFNVDDICEYLTSDTCKVAYFETEAILPANVQGVLLPLVKVFNHSYLPLVISKLQE
jgi:hypothetical protein